ncbi:MAG: malto-oligosyltrehalose synthase, partial [Clostridia bacterium]|nr:malto-oligosyltrehalose synthase [Clostridia bacterium]
MIRIPTALYRLQFNHDFKFSDASEIIAYLAELGISHVYASPVFLAKKGSLHGYDIVDPHKLNDELGTKADFDALTAKVSDYRMGWVQDIVPNHMAIDCRNRLLMELLENGPEVLALNHFDIEWNHQYESIRGRLLAPILGNTYAECLENGEIKLTYDQNGFSLCYYEHRFPLKMETYGIVLEHDLEKLKTDLGSSHSGLIKLLGVLFAIKNLPAAHQGDARKAQVSFTKAILWELYTSDQAIHNFIDFTLEQFNGIKGKPETFTLLDNLHTQQLYKLSFWKVATEELNYRRFFTVNDLISIRVEDEQVFRDTHQLIFELINQGRINGLRVDHIDGLYDPHTYLERLRRGAPDSYIVVEKILSRDETLPNVWPVQGTTGYDFCNYVNQIFCKSENERSINSIYRRFTGLRIEYDHLLTDRKRIILLKHMAGDIDNLALLIKGVSGTDRRGSDITLYGLRKALIELMAFFPVYRSYINGTIFSNEDRLHLQRAIADARRTDPALSREFAFIERFLLLKYEPYISEEKKNEWTNVVMRFQQFTGPLMAKGFEDTVLYNFNRLISLNEVGSWPDTFGISNETFHRFNTKRVRLWPNTINSTSTHDTKRGEDVRARINVLSEIPEEWEMHLKLWSILNRKWKTITFNHSIPDSNDEYFFYQTLLGTFPTDISELDSFIPRIREYMLKSVREAKVHTAWITHDFEYEEGVMAFVT